MKSILLKLGKLMGVRVLAIVLTFVQTIVMTRVFGSEVFGLLSFGLSISALLILVLSFGLDQVLMRDIARFGKAVAPKTERWTHVWHLIRRWVIPVTLTVAVTGVLVSELTDLAGVYRVSLIGTFLMLPVILFRKYVEAISLGTKQVVRSIIGSQIAYPILMIIGGLSVMALGLGSSAMTVTATYVCAGFGSLIVAILLIYPTFSSLRADGFGARDIVGESPGHRAILTSGGHFALVAFGFILGQHISVLMTGVLAGPEDVALVRIAARVAEMAGLMRTIVLLQYKPLLAEAYGKGDTALLQKHAYFMSKVLTITGVPATLGLWIFADRVMGVFGPEFVDGAWAMRLYVSGVFFLLICGPGSTFLSFCGQEHLASRNLLVSVAIQFVLNLFLIPLFGPEGCAAASCVAMTYLAFSGRRLAIQKVGVDPSIFVIFKKV
ncbi:polysaccharide biosynthesis C-terminal domain-containing protein [Pacificibacter sp. AS14]|uniref:oligosaccharide flippase family protein n=1 Tax=Pacificibacter sp. AS14 TaxID=3135785 RepID=UPI0031710F51